MTELDLRLLGHLQLDSSPPLSVLAEKVGLSTSACHRRVRQLEESGVISGYRAMLDPEALGLRIEVIVQISLSSQAQDTLEKFEAAVVRFPEILECWLVAGQADYMLRIMAEDIEDYDRIHRNCLSRLPAVSSMESVFALRRIKSWQGYRLPG